MTYSVCMPRLDNIGIHSPVPPDWKLVLCPECGDECFETDLCRMIVKDPDNKAVCTKCALKKTQL